MRAILTETVQQVLKTEAELAAELIVDDREDEELRIEQPARDAEQGGLPAAVCVDRIAANAQVVFDIEGEDPLGDNVEGVQDEVGH